MTLQQKIEQLEKTTSLSSDDKKTIAELKKYVEETENTKDKSGLYILYLAVIGVIAAWFANWILLCIYGGNYTEKGQFGDMFGSINALFSGLAFAFLIYTVWLQREEFRLQRKEFELQRKALELQAVEQTRQADELTKTVKLQEKTFELRQRQTELEVARLDEERFRVSEQNEPKFISHGIQCNLSSGTPQIILHMVNKGEQALSVSFKSNENLQNNGTLYSVFAKERSIDLSWLYKSMDQIPPSTPLEIVFKTLNGKNKSITAYIIKNEQATALETMFSFELNQ
jgi:hypothetical protein